MPWMIAVIDGGLFEAVLPVPVFPLSPDELGVGLGMVPLSLPLLVVLPPVAVFPEPAVEEPLPVLATVVVPPEVEVPPVGVGVPPELPVVEVVPPLVLPLPLAAVVPVPVVPPDGGGVTLPVSLPPAGVGLGMLPLSPEEAVVEPPVVVVEPVLPCVVVDELPLELVLLPAPVVLPLLAPVLVLPVEVLVEPDELVPVLCR